MNFWHLWDILFPGRKYQPRRLRRVDIRPDLLAAMFETGNEITGVRVTEGIPPGAKLVRTFYDPVCDIISLIVEHESFAELSPGLLIEVLPIMVMRETSPVKEAT